MSPWRGTVHRTETIDRQEASHDCQRGPSVNPAQPEDRRSFVIALTPKGRRAFERMARVHEGWVIELLGGIPDKAKQQMYELLGQLRAQLAGHAGHAEAEPVEKKRTKK